MIAVLHQVGKRLSIVFGLCFVFCLGLSVRPVSSQAATAKTVKKASSSTSSKKVTRTREDMILEVEMKALKEALESRQDEESISKFADKADMESTAAKEEADKSRTMLETANKAQSEVAAAKEEALALVAKAKAAAEEADTLASKAKTDAKLAGVDTATYADLHVLAKKEVSDAENRLNSAQSVLDQARSQEDYYRSLVKRRIKNAEDFYYIAEAAMKKGGNAQALEFAVKAKAEMEQAKIAENEAEIRAEATKAAEKVVEARKQSTAAAKIKFTALAQLLKLTQEISATLTEAYQAAALSAKAAQQYMDKMKDFASAKDAVVTFSSKKVDSLTNIKDSAEKKEALTIEAAQSAHAVLAAKQKAKAEAEAKAQSALGDARSVVLGAQGIAPTAAPASVPATAPVQ